MKGRVGERNLRRKVGQVFKTHRRLNKRYGKQAGHDEWQRAMRRMMGF